MKQSNTAPIVLGVISICLAVISFFVFWWLSAVGAVLGIIGTVLAWRDPYAGTAGKALSVIGLVLSAIMFVLSVIVILVV